MLHQSSHEGARMLLAGSVVGVWNGWGYGIAIFRALNLQSSEPEIWQKLEGKELGP